MTRIKADALDLADAAEAWLRRLNSGEATASDRARFAAWRLADPAHARAYANAEALWALAAEVRDHSEIRALRAKAMSPAPRRSAGLGWRAAAAALVLVFGAGIVARLALAPSAFERVVFAERVSTAVGERRDVVLPDGSTVTLDTATRIAIAFSGERRRVRLETGRARFDVAHDAARPFVVAAGPSDVAALGTQFDVRYLDKTATVVLLEGSVSVAAPGSDAAVILAAGETVTYADGLLGAPEAADVEAADGWTAGRLVFSGAPLSAVVAEVNRYSERRIRLDDPALGGLRFRGALEAGDVDAAIRALTLIYELDAETAPNGDVVLRRAL